MGERETGRGGALPQTREDHMPTVTPEFRGEPPGIWTRVGTIKCGQPQWCTIRRGAVRTSTCNREGGPSPLYSLPPQRLAGGGNQMNGSGKGSTSILTRVGTMNARA